VFHSQVSSTPNYNYLKTQKQKLNVERKAFLDSKNIGTEAEQSKKIMPVTNQ